MSDPHAGRSAQAERTSGDEEEDLRAAIVEQSVRRHGDDPRAAEIPQPGAAVARLQRAGGAEPALHGDALPAV